ncbi:MAG: riboflavin synthase [Pseudomonadota bacterium]
MFTGLIEEIGTVAAVNQTDTSFDLTIRARTVLEGVTLGDSIAVNGVCLTVTRFDGDSFTVGLAPETQQRTNLGALKRGASVNLERSVMPTTRMGGHYVQGHVDGTGEIIDLRPDQDALWVTIRLDPALMRYVVTKGYVAIDGTSLTVVDTGPDWFNVTLIAYTQQKIILAKKPVGDTVNLEVDILAKYVERLVVGQTDAAKPALTSKFLSAHGYSKKEAS